MTIFYLAMFDIRFPASVDLSCGAKDTSTVVLLKK